MKSNLKFIVLVSLNIGGAERRFYDIFKGLYKEDKNFYLVVPFNLATILNIDSQENIVVLGEKDINFLSFIRLYRKFLAENDFIGCSFHYPMNCLFFLHILKKHRVTMSLTNCYSAPKLLTTRKSLLRQYLSIYFVQHIDVLSPEIFKIIHRKFPKNTSLTPNGTYVIMHLEMGAKKNYMGFLGRFIEGKGVDELLDILPDVWCTIKEYVPEDFEFLVAGYGSLQNIVEDKLVILKKKDVPVKYVGYISPKDFVEQCRGVFSLQRVTNYPSRVVAESLLGGCSVIIRNSGDSKEFGDLKGIFYIDEVLNPQDISNAILKIFSSDFNINEAKLIQSEATERFSNPKVLSYFKEIMNYQVKY